MVRDRGLGHRVFGLKDRVYDRVGVSCSGFRVHSSQALDKAWVGSLALKAWFNRCLSSSKGLFW